MHNVAQCRLTYLKPPEIFGFRWFLFEERTWLPSHFTIWLLLKLKTSTIRFVVDYAPFKM